MKIRIRNVYPMQRYRMRVRDSLRISIYILLVYAVNLHDPDTDTICDADCDIRDGSLLNRVGAMRHNISLGAERLIHDKAYNSRHRNARLERNLLQLSVRLGRHREADIPVVRGLHDSLLRFMP